MRTTVENNLLKCCKCAWNNIGGCLRVENSIKPKAPMKEKIQSDNIDAADI